LCLPPYMLVLYSPLFVIFIPVPSEVTLTKPFSGTKAKVSDAVLVDLRTDSFISALPQVTYGRNNLEIEPVFGSVFYTDLNEIPFDRICGEYTLDLIMKYNGDLNYISLTQKGFHESPASCEVTLENMGNTLNSLNTFVVTDNYLLEEDIKPLLAGAIPLTNMLLTDDVPLDDLSFADTIKLLKNKSGLTPKTIILIDPDAERNNISVERLFLNLFRIHIEAVNREKAANLFEFVIMSGSESPMSFSDLKMVLGSKLGFSRHEIGDLIDVDGYLARVADIQPTFAGGKNEVVFELFDGSVPIAVFPEMSRVVEGSGTDFGGITGSRLVVKDAFSGGLEEKPYVVTCVERKSSVPKNHKYGNGDVIDVASVDGYLIEVSDIESFVFKKDGVFLTLLDNDIIIDRVFVKEGEKTDFNGILDSNVFVYHAVPRGNELTSYAVLFVESKSIVLKRNCDYGDRLSSDRLGIKDVIEGIGEYSVEFSDADIEVGLISKHNEEYIYLTLLKGEEIIAEEKIFYNDHGFQTATDFNGILDSNVIVTRLYVGCEGGSEAGIIVEKKSVGKTNIVIDSNKMKVGEEIEIDNNYKVLLKEVYRGMYGEHAVLVLFKDMEEISKKPIKDGESTDFDGLADFHVTVLDMFIDAFEDNYATVNIDYKH